MDNDITVNSLLNDSHVGGALVVILLHELGNVIDILPLLFIVVGSDVEGQVSNNSRWSSGNRRVTVDVNLHFLLIDEVIQPVSSLENALTVLSFRDSVVNWDVVEGVDTVLSVLVVEEFGVSLSLVDLFPQLEVDNGPAARFGNLVNVSWIERIWADSDVGFVNV